MNVNIIKASNREGEEWHEGLLSSVWWQCEVAHDNLSTCINSNVNEGGAEHATLAELAAAILQWLHMRTKQKGSIGV